LTARLLVGIFASAAPVAEALRQKLTHSLFVISWSDSATEFIDWVVSNRHRIDCLVIQQTVGDSSILEQLGQRGILLPTLYLEIADEGTDHTTDSLINSRSERIEAEAVYAMCTPSAISPETVLDPITQYHNAVMHFNTVQLDQIESFIQDAIDRFLQLPSRDFSTSENQADKDHQLFLLSLQQQRLTEKLHERLGYLGVYYKRNPQNFLRNLTLEERHEFVDKLRLDYRQIILQYFASDGGLNQKIDDFVNLAFFADVSVSKIVELHMELMDDFSKQLHLEGRSEEILLDYRLTLIDVIAHLCEMYRRSIPREM
jgi:circadian clock protein KaiA